MKKIFTLILSLLPALGMMAQEADQEGYGLGGKWELRADGGINWGINDDPEKEAMGLARLGAMYHFNNHIGLGLGAGYAGRMGHHFSNGVPVVANLHWRWLGTTRVSPYLEAYGGYIFSVGRADYSSKYYKHSNCDGNNYGVVGANLGLEWAVTKRFGVRAAANYNYLIQAGDGNCPLPNDPKLGNLHEIGFNLGAYIVLGKCAPVAAPVVIPAVVEPEAVYKTVTDTVWYDAKEYRDELVNTEKEWVVFYDICGSDFAAEKQLAEIGKFIADGKDVKVSVKSYADRGTGNPKVNLGYARQRNEKAVAALKAAGVAESAMTSEFLGDKEQPYAENDKNRCTIIRATGLLPVKKEYPVRKFRLENRQVRVN